MKRSGRKVAAGSDFRLAVGCFMHSGVDPNMSDSQDSYASVDVDAFDIDADFDVIAASDSKVADDEAVALFAVTCDCVAGVVAAHALVLGAVAAALLAVVCDYVAARGVAAQALVSGDADASSGRPSTARTGFADASTQCCVEDMIQPMARIPSFQQRCAERIRQGVFCQDLEVSYSAAEHFSMVESPSTFCLWSCRLSQDQVEVLAGRFLGVEIAGIVPKHCSPFSLRRVGGRHVTEAAMLARMHPRFRQALLRSAHQLLEVGIKARPFGGSSILTLAFLDKGWSAAAATALDFALRLTRAGALPATFIPEVVGRSFALYVPTLAVIASASLCRERQPRLNEGRLQIQRRCLLHPVADVRELDLPRTVSAPVRRTVGTSLTPHLREDVQAKGSVLSRCSRSTVRIVTFAGPGMWTSQSGEHRVREKEIIPIEISDADLPHYWLWAAGGEHSLKTRSRKSCEASNTLLMRVALSALSLKVLGQE